MRSSTLRFVSLPFALASALASLACSGSKSTPPAGDTNIAESSLARNTSPQTSSQDTTALASDDTHFAFDLYKGFATDETSNVFYSPYSISIALSMAYAGAQGDTATQMANVLHFDLPNARLFPAFDAVDLAITSRAQSSDGTNDGFTLNVADSIWGDDTQKFVPAYLDTMATYYGSGVRLANFEGDPEGARGEINDWVANETNQKITDLMPEGTIDSSTRAVLVNAIYFKASWQSQFDPTKTSTVAFTKNDGSTVQAPTMSIQSSFKYVNASSYQAVELPYVGGDTSMVVVLPNQGQFATVESSLSADFFSAVTTSLAAGEVQLGLPKFKIAGASIDVSSELELLGMTDAFDPTKADFLGMLEPSGGADQFWISHVIHKAYVNVDESGTEAAAATGVGFGAAVAVSNPVPIEVNRSFLFFIRDIPTGSVLFVGRVVDPTA